MKVRIGTRGSKLAMWQANTAEKMVQKAFPNAETEIVIVKTEGDKDQKSSLKSMGGYGVFVKTIENELLANNVDIAVHSAKDMPASMDEKLIIAATPPREEVNDVLMSNSKSTLKQLPQNANIGTSSARRQAQILNNRPDLKINEIRGNVETRLRKVAEKKYDATLLAYAGVKRLGLEDKICEKIDLETILPAPGQGVVVLQCRKNDSKLFDGLKKVSDEIAYVCLMAERAFLRKLKAGCHAAVAGYARIENEKFVMSGRVLSPDGSKVLEAQFDNGSIEDPEELGYRIGEALLKQGADRLLKITD